MSARLLLGKGCTSALDLDRPTGIAACTQISVKLNYELHCTIKLCSRVVQLGCAARLCSTQPIQG